MEKHRKTPSRMCVVCRRMRDKSELIRVVKNKNGEYSVDSGGKLPGRGAYVCIDGDCISRLDKARGLERAFKSSVPEDIKSELKARTAEKSGLGK